MVYLKSALFGLLTALAAAVLWMLVTFVLPIAIPVLTSRLGADGIGGAAATVSSASILVAALVGFVSGFYWCLRGASRPRLQPGR